MWLGKPRPPRRTIHPPLLSGSLSYRTTRAHTSGRAPRRHSPRRPARGTPRMARLTPEGAGHPLSGAPGPAGHRLAERDEDGHARFGPDLARPMALAGEVLSDQDVARSEALHGSVADLDIDRARQRE